MGDMMNGGTSSDRGRWRGWPRRAGVLAVAAGAVVLAAACGGSPSSAGSGGSPSAGGTVNSPLLAFSQCMRSHGVPDFPDPQPGQVTAKFPGAKVLGVASSRYQAAEKACRHLLSAGTGGLSRAEAQQMLPAMRRFSQCVRSHGVPNWPDPSIHPDPLRGGFKVLFNLVGLQGVNSPQAITVGQQCQHLLPRQFGGVPVFC